MKLSHFLRGPDEPARSEKLGLVYLTAMRDWRNLSKFNSKLSKKVEGAMIKNVLLVAVIAILCGAALGVITSHGSAGSSPDHFAEMQKLEPVTKRQRSNIVAKPQRPSSEDLRRARLLRQATRDYDRALAGAESDIRRLRSQASELALRLFSREFDAAENLIVEGREICADSLEMADATEAGNATISDSWLSDMQQRVSQWQRRLDLVISRLP